MKKKIISWVLASVMIASFCGCGAAGNNAVSSAKEEKSSSDAGAGATNGSTTSAEANSDPSEWPVVTVQIPAITEMPDGPIVEEALNNYLKSINAGVQAKLVQTALGDLANQLTLMLSDNQNPLDLFCWRFYSTLDNCVKNEQCIPLDKYLDEYSDMWAMYPENVLKTQQIGGVQYAVPSVDSYATYEVYNMRKDIAEELGIADRDGERISKDELTKIMKEVVKKHPEMAAMINTNDEPFIGIDSFGNSNWLGVLLNRGVGTTKVVNLYETPEWRDYCYMMKDWSDAGIFIDDPLNNELTITQYNNGVAAGCFMGGYSPDYIKALIAYSPYESVQYQLTDLVGTSSSVLGGWMISSVCKNPDAAMKMLYLMTTDKNVARTLILGVEGTHYTIDEKGIARRPEGVTQANTTWNQDCPWFYPNQCLSIPLETEMATYYSDMLDAPKHAKFSDAMGFVFDSTPVYDQMAACTTVVAQYRNALLYGLVDVDSYLEKFNAELKAAGIDDIVNAEQEQLDAWKAAQ